MKSRFLCEKNTIVISIIAKVLGTLMRYDFSLRIIAVVFSRRYAFQISPIITIPLVIRKFNKCKNISRLSLQWMMADKGGEREIHSYTTYHHLVHGKSLFLSVSIDIKHCS